MMTFDDGSALISITVCYDSFVNESKNKSHNKYDSSKEIIGSCLSAVLAFNSICQSKVICGIYIPHSIASS